MDPNFKNPPPTGPVGQSLAVPPTPPGDEPVKIPDGIYPTAPDVHLTPSEVAQTVHPKPKKSREGWKSIAGTVLLLILAPVIALSITALAFQSYQVDGASMETTLQNNDRLIVNKISRTIARITHHGYLPDRGDIIIFNKSNLFGAGSGQKQLIKRVIGLPGEEVSVENGVVMVYNKANPNGFNPDEVGIYRLSAKNTPGSTRLTLKEGEVFVLGDNRTNSEDSRYFGPITADDIVGKLSVRIMPLDKIQKF